MLGANGLLSCDIRPQCGGSGSERVCIASTGYGKVSGDTFGTIQNCTSAKGILGETCDLTGAVAGCRGAGAGSGNYITYTYWYYSGTVQDVMAKCPSPMTVVMPGASGGTDAGASQCSAGGATDAAVANTGTISGPVTVNGTTVQFSCTGGLEGAFSQYSTVKVDCYDTLSKGLNGRSLYIALVVTPTVGIHTHSIDAGTTLIDGGYDLAFAQLVALGNPTGGDGNYEAYSANAADTLSITVDSYAAGPPARITGSASATFASASMDAAAAGASINVMFDVQF